MLRKGIDREGRDWNKWVPYVLFAFREAPQASTGFSPFELVYGRDVRGPLNVLQEGWIGEQQDSQDDVLSYVQGVYDRLQESKEIVRQNMEKSQRRQKSWYDQKARETNLNVGDKVLVLLPTRTEKLLAKWKGPYPITKKVGQVNYDIQLSDCRKKLFHINMLKRWHESEESENACWIQDEEEELPYYRSEVQDIDTATYEQQLDDEQKLKVKTSHFTIF